MGPIWVIVVAGGSGARFGTAKQYEPLAGRRVLDWSLEAARACADGVVLVVPADRVGPEEPAADCVVAGGASRAASVRAGLAAVPDDADIVLVHDAARPLAGPALFAVVVDALRDPAVDGAIPAVPVVDTIRRRDGGAIDRSELVAVQTPQGFRASTLRRAHRDAPEATDDASVVEAAGGTVVLVPGESTNIKITSPADLSIAAAFLDLEDRAH